MKKNFNLIPLLLISLMFGCKSVSKDDHQNEESALQETIIRRHKRVIRYNCKDEITSDKIETIRAVSKKFSIDPASSKIPWGFSATNETTRSTQGSVWFGKGVFTLDLAPTLFNIKANEGLNKISWSFSYCDKKDEEGKNCLYTPEVRETGVLFINIKQETVFEEGVEEIRPTGEACQ
jgi:hypothetical protein